MDEAELEADLEAWMTGETLTLDDAERILEPPRDADQAEKLLRARRWLLSEVTRVEGIAYRQIEQIGAWRDDRTGGLHRRVAAVEKVLEQWMRAVNREQPLRKSEHLPSGRVQLRKPGAYRAQVTEEDELLAWVEKNHPALVKRSPKVADVKALCQAGPAVSENPDPSGETWYAAVVDGEAVPGLALARDNQDTFSVK